MISVSYTELIVKLLVVLFIGNLRFVISRTPPYDTRTISSLLSPLPSLNKSISHNISISMIVYKVFPSGSDECSSYVDELK